MKSVMGWRYCVRVDGAFVAGARRTWAFQDQIAVPAATCRTPSGASFRLDISFFDPLTQLDYVADRSNASVDIFSAPEQHVCRSTLGTPPTFAGHCPLIPWAALNSISGPDGVQVVNMPGQHQVFVGDGPSTVWGFNI